MATMGKPVFRPGMGYSIQGHRQHLGPGTVGTSQDGAQAGCELAEGEFKGSVVRPVQGQKQQIGTSNGRPHAGGLVNAQIVAYYYVTGHKHSPK